MVPLEDDSTFYPRYLSNINQAISNCREPRDLVLLHARRAGYYARHSLPAKAKEIIRDLKASNQAYDPHLTGWLTLSEGLIPYFELLDNVSAKAKFATSLRMGQIANNKELVGIAAAWLANSEYALGETASAIENLTLSISLTAPACSDARGRAYLLLGDMLYWTGQQELARHWYRESRKYAVLDGDIAMQNIILFNTANYAVWALNIRDCQFGATEADWKIPSLEVASAKNLNAALRIHNLPSLIPNMEAELMVVQHRWQEAEQIYSETILQVNEEGKQRSISKMLAQRAWCRANVGKPDEAADDISNAKLHAADCDDFDDLFVVHSRLCETSRIVGDSVSAEVEAKAAQDQLHSFRKHQENISQSLEPILSMLSKEAKNPA